MDIANLSIAMASVKTAQSIQISVMKQIIDQTAQTGEILSEMIETAGTIDIKI